MNEEKELCNSIVNFIKDHPNDVLCSFKKIPELLGKQLILTFNKYKIYITHGFIYEPVSFEDIYYKDKKLHFNLWNKRKILRAARNFLKNKAKHEKESLINEALNSKGA